MKIITPYYLCDSLDLFARPVLALLKLYYKITLNLLASHTKRQMKGTHFVSCFTGMTSWTALTVEFKPKLPSLRKTRLLCQQPRILRGK